MTEWLQDLRYGARMIRKRPGHLRDCHRRARARHRPHHDDVLDRRGRDPARSAVSGERPDHVLTRATVQRPAAATRCRLTTCRLAGAAEGLHQLAGYYNSSVTMSGAVARAPAAPASRRTRCLCCASRRLGATSGRGGRRCPAWRSSAIACGRALQGRPRDRRQWSASTYAGHHRRAAREVRISDSQEIWLPAPSPAGETGEGQSFRVIGGCAMA